MTIGGSSQSEFKDNIICFNDPNIRITGGNPILCGNTIESSRSSYGVECTCGSGTLLKNTIQYNELVQVRIDLDAAPNIQNNLVAFGRSAGILVTGRSSAYISKNDLLSNNGLGVIVSEKAAPNIVAKCCQDCGKNGLEFTQ